MPPASMSRAEIVAILTEVFRRLGYDGASMAEISEATGLGRSSLYHWFSGGKQEMAAAALEALVERLAGDLAAAVEDDAPVQERLDRVLAVLDRLYDGGRAACLLERLCASAAREPLRPALRGAFDAWVGVMARLQRDAGADARTAEHRAEDAVARIEGALVLCAARGDTGPFRRVLDDLGRTFLPAGALP